MERKLRMNIEKTVREILEKSNWDKVTEKQIRKQASERLELDLDEPVYKDFVREVVNSFIEENKGKQKEKEDDDDDDDGDRLICKLGSNRKVTVQKYKGSDLVSIRDYFLDEDGMESPTKKGISLNKNQWSILKKNTSAIEEAIKEMQHRLQQ